ncbi:type I restriction enzyme EcoKI subunit R [Corynebacterium ciconiae DSM 44920]|nr:type I restriction enzyme EcoKI subunit R [Corynebacterium ciconiae DSM 44920]
MLAAITREMERCNSFTFSVAFITPDALALLKPYLLRFEGRAIIITSTYLDFNNPDMFEELLQLPNIEVRVVDDHTQGFHAKGYIFSTDFGVTAIVGSANMTRHALMKNQEWNVKFSAMKHGDITYQIQDAANYQYSISVPLTAEWIKKYRAHRRPPSYPRHDPQLPSHERITPNAMQLHALEELSKLHSTGAKKALIISATGTGKTILAALAVRAAQPRRLLFLAHREQIVRKAQQEFRRVIEADNKDFSVFLGANRDASARFVFSTVQTMSQPSSLGSLDPDHFDYIIIDEAHRSAASSYEKITKHFTPDFLLGLTATPERTDEKSVYEFFDYNVAFEIRLSDALENNMLTPFDYYGVADYVTESGETVDDSTELKYLVAEERVEHLLEKLRIYGRVRNVCGLIFCSRAEEARELSQRLNEAELFGRRLRTVALTSDDHQKERERAIERLESGELDYIITVDLFNEGIDIPKVNQIVMLRPTQSVIVFTQQLGRGLRKYPEKDNLRVIDFIGNYKNNFLVPMALHGTTRRRDVLRDGTRGAKAVSGLSHISFDKVAQQRILAAINSASMDHLRILKEDIAELHSRLNAVPTLYDFARFDRAEPEVLALKMKNYWSLLNSTKFCDVAPTEVQAGMLNLLSLRILNGKRPHESLLLRRLIDGPATNEEIATLFVDYGTTSHQAVIDSAVRVLTGEFDSWKKDPQFPIIARDAHTLRLSQNFEANYRSSALFKKHVDDIITTSLFLNREKHSIEGKMIVGKLYNREDFCRLFNWKRNERGVINGYKIDKDTNTCPIYITHHKGDGFSESTRYEDYLDSAESMTWYTRGNRTLKSKELIPIINNSVELHMFAKRDDREGTDFFYLGPVTSRDAVNERMPVEDRSIDIVRMKLDFEVPVDPADLSYLRGAET